MNISGPAVDFVRDTITALQEVGDTRNVDFLDEMLRHDGPDIDGCVSSLALNGLVTREWVDRLTEMNAEHDYDEELTELTEALNEAAAAK